MGLPLVPYLKHGWFRPFEMPIDWILNPKSSNDHHPPAHVSRGRKGRPWKNHDPPGKTSLKWQLGFVGPGVLLLAVMSTKYICGIYIYMVSQKKTQLGISLHELIGIPLASMTPLQILSPAVLHKSQVGHKMMLLWPTTTYNRLYTTTYTIYTWWILPLFFPIKKKIIWGYTPFSDTNYYIIWSWKCKNYRKNIPIDVLHII